MLARITFTENTPPEYYVLLKLWCQIFGTSELSLRLPPALIGIASVGLLYRFVRYCVGPTEGLIAAPETCHAIRGAIDLALEAKKRNEETVIAFNYSGHGLLDLEGYAQFLAGNLSSNGP